MSASRPTNIKLKRKKRDGSAALDANHGEKQMTWKSFRIGLREGHNLNHGNPLGQVIVNEFANKHHGIILIARIRV